MSGQVNGSLRVWWIRNPPATTEAGHPIYGRVQHVSVSSVEEAKQVIERFTREDLADSNVTMNVGGLEIKGEPYKGNDTGWVEWHDPETDYDIMQLMDEVG